MDEELKGFCDRHGLRSMSVMYQSKFKAFTAYLHWGTSDEGGCASGSGDTVHEALTEALSDMDSMKSAEAAWERQQQSLMESAGPDDSSYRRDMQNAGRGHLLKG